MAASSSPCLLPALLLQITAVTAQNTQGVQSVHVVPLEALAAQVGRDIKTGFRRLLLYSCAGCAVHFLICPISKRTRKCRGRVAHGCWLMGAGSWVQESYRNRACIHCYEPSVGWSSETWRKCVLVSVSYRATFLFKKNYTQ